MIDNLRMIRSRGERAITDQGRRPARTLQSNLLPFYSLAVSAGGNERQWNVNEQWANAVNGSIESIPD